MSENLMTYMTHLIEMPVLTLHNLFEMSIILAMIGILGVMSNSKNLLISIMAMEMMYYALNLMFLMAAVYLDDIMGEVMAVFVLMLAGGESAMALALLTTYYRTHYSMDLREEL